MQPPVDDGAAFKTNSHPAQRATRFSTDRFAARRAGQRNGHGDRRAGRDSNRSPIDGDRDRLRHKRAPPEHETASTARPGWQDFCRQSDRRAAAR